jgi:hypothetical protein
MDIPIDSWKRKETFFLHQVSLLHEPMSAPALMLGGMQSHLVPSWLFDMARTTCAHATQGVEADEVFQVNFLAVCQIPKLHATMPQCYSAGREFARHCGIPNGLKRYLLKTKTTIRHQYSQFGRSMGPRLTSNVTKRKPTPAYIYDLTQCCKLITQRGEAAVVDCESSMLPPFNQLFPVYGSCTFLHSCPPLCSFYSETKHQQNMMS